MPSDKDGNGVADKMNVSATKGEGKNLPLYLQAACRYESRRTKKPNGNRQELKTEEEGITDASAKIPPVQLDK